MKGCPSSCPGDSPGVWWPRVWPPAVPPSLGPTHSRTRPTGGGAGPGRRTPGRWPRTGAGGLTRPRHDIGGCGDQTWTWSGHCTGPGPRHRGHVSRVSPSTRGDPHVSPGQDVWLGPVYSRLYIHLLHINIIFYFLTFITPSRSSFNFLSSHFTICSPTWCEGDVVRWIVATVGALPRPLLTDQLAVLHPRASAHVNLGQRDDIITRMGFNKIFQK